MAQGTLSIINQGFPSFRADLNDQLEALATLSSGPTAPTTTYPFQLWVDTSQSPPVLNQRNEANNAWFEIFSADGLAGASTGTNEQQIPLNADLTFTITVTGNHTVDLSPDDRNVKYVVYVDAATAEVTIPENLHPSCCISVIKVNSTQGTVRIKAGASDDQWAYSSIAENADGDPYIQCNAENDQWVVRNSPNGYRLEYGWETGENSDGEWERLSSGFVTERSANAIEFENELDDGDTDTQTWSFPIPCLQTSGGGATFSMSIRMSGGQNADFIGGHTGDGQNETTSIPFRVRRIRGESPASAPLSGIVFMTARWLEA